MQSDPRAARSRIGPAVTILLLILVLQFATFGAVLWPYKDSERLLLEYPFWWPDTFDWTKQAIVILDLISERITDYIEVWRPRDPFFLAILVASLGLNAEWLLLLALGLCNVFFVVGMFKLGRAFGLSWYDSALATTLLILNYSFRIFSLHIMGDFFAITAMLWVAILLVRILGADPARFTPQVAFWTYLAIAISSATQVFTLIPGIIFSFVYFFIHSRKLPVLKRALNMVIGLIVVALVRWLIGLAKNALFGTSLDDRMKFLKITTESVGFYSESLLVLVVPILVIILLRITTVWRLLKPHLPSANQLFFLGTILTFCLLILSYSTWKEARLLTFFLPFLYLFFLSLFPRNQNSSPRFAKVFVPIEMIMGIALTMTPVGFIMGPKLDQYLDSASHLSNLVSLKTLVAGTNYPSESMRLQDCVAPDDSSGAAGNGLFGNGNPNCDPYLHYNLKVYWCFKAGVARCFKGAS